MKVKLLLYIALSSVCSWSHGQDTTFYLGNGHQYDATVPKPQDVLGYQVGQWHVRHDQLVNYMRVLAHSSSRVQVETIGYTYEQRPLLHLTISSPKNLARLATLQQEHLALAGAEHKADLNNMPLVVWLGYSVHGNEPSGSNASLMVAYHLAAASDIDELLENTVIILDPSLNPDGLSRFAQWANMHKGSVLVADGNHREHSEAWPSGRTNHYWFDLNRDWLLLQHPESRARIARFHSWRPNILTDAHEMGTDSTYFFQPGIPSRQNPLTPDMNLELTRLIATYHAAAFNKQGVLYFAEQNFDDFYYGKGSTYPDIQGSIGILFEQASSRGFLQKNDQGPLAFPDTIKNQVTTSMTTLEAGLKNRVKLLTYQRDFFAQTRKLAADDGVRAYAIGSDGDPARAHAMMRVLQQHQIEVYPLEGAVTVGDTTIQDGFLVPTNQAQYRLVKSLFEEVTSFNDNTFYDVSSWHFPSAFGLPFVKLDAKAMRGRKTENKLPSTPPRGTIEQSDQPPYAWLFDWQGYFAPRAAQRLLAAGVMAKFAGSPFTAVTANGPRRFSYGTIMIPCGIQTIEYTDLMALFETMAEEDGISLYAAKSGLTPDGIDFGSPSFDGLTAPKPLLVTGAGLSTYEVGEVWHLLDHRFNIPVAMTDSFLLSRTNLDDYSHLILVSGSYPGLNKDTKDRIQSWVRSGGNLVALNRAGQWLQKNDFIDMTPREKEKETGPANERLPYENRRQDQQLQRISGAIFKARLDLSHPLCFGYTRDQVTTFRNSTFFYEPDPSPYQTVAAYTGTPLVSGYVSAENLALLAGSAAVIAQGKGRGSITVILDNPNFRGYWYGTNKMLLNSLFFSSMIRPERFGREASSAEEN